MSLTILTWAIVVLIWVVLWFYVSALVTHWRWKRRHRR